MKFILKGELDVLGNYKTVQEVYMALPNILSILHKTPYNAETRKRELSFLGDNNLLLGHQIKAIENKQTDTLTIIVK